MRAHYSRKLYPWGSTSSSPETGRGESPLFPDLFISDGIGVLLNSMIIIVPPHTRVCRKPFPFRNEARVVDRLLNVPVTVRQLTLVGRSNSKDKGTIAMAYCPGSGASCSFRR